MPHKSLGWGRSDMKSITLKIQLAYEESFSKYVKL